MENQFYLSETTANEYVKAPQGMTTFLGVDDVINNITNVEFGIFTPHNPASDNEKGIAWKARELARGNETAFGSMIVTTGDGTEVSFPMSNILATKIVKDSKCFDSVVVGAVEGVAGSPKVGNKPAVKAVEAVEGIEMYVWKADYVGRIIKGRLIQTKTSITI